MVVVLRGVVWGSVFNGDVQKDLWKAVLVLG